MGPPDFLFDVDERSPPSSGAEARSSSVANLTARYRYLVQLSSVAGISSAIHEALSALTPAEREELLRRLGSEVGSTSAGEADDQALAISRCAAELEQRDPGALERILCGGAADARQRTLWLRFVGLLSSSESGRARLESLLLSEADPDFSEEFGFERGFAGGEGFENVDFDRWV